MRPPPFRYHSRCMQHTALPHAVPSRFRTTLTAMHANVVKMIMHLCCCWPIPLCAALFTAYGQLATCTCIRISACVHSHAHGIACMHDARMPIYPMPYFGRYCRAFMQNSVFRASGCAAHFALHGGVPACTTLHAVCQSQCVDSHGVIWLACAGSCLHMCCMRTNSVVL